MRHLPLFLIVLLLLAGCSTSRWTGTWQAADSPEHGGDLHCVAKKIGDGKWKAKFSGYCGRQFVYKIDMDGHEEGEQVAFGGEVDLGEDGGGVYTWTGAMTGKEFNGEYTTEKGGTGKFEMRNKERQP
jgi:hypothetical protein